MPSTPPGPLDPESVGLLLDRLAHDTRTPLAALLMWVRLLRAGQAPTAHALAVIERNAMALSARIDEIQPLADRLRGGKIAPDKTEPSEPAPGSLAEEGDAHREEDTTRRRE